MSYFTCKDLVVDLPSEGETKRVVDGVSFDLERGKVYDLVGPSGGGKSTVLLACARMIPIESGELNLEGRPSASFPPVQWRSRVCLVPQNARIVEGTVRDNLLLPWRFSIRKGVEAPDDSRMLRALQQAMLDDVSLDRDASQLSGGQSARVALLRSFLANPDVLLLDEVDAALDDESSRVISALTARQVEGGATCLRIRHRAPDGLAARIFEIKEGRLA